MEMFHMKYKLIWLLKAGIEFEIDICCKFGGALWVYRIFFMWKWIFSNLGYIANFWLWFFIGCIAFTPSVYPVAYITYEQRHVISNNVVFWQV